MKLSQLTSTDMTLAKVKASSREEVLQLLVDRLASLGHITGPDALLKAILAREAVETTAIGGGIAIPHVRSASIEGSLVMIASLSEPVPFDSMDDKPVDLVFLLACNPANPARPLKVLARISRLVQKESFLTELRGCESSEAILALLEDAETALD